MDIVTSWEKRGIQKGFSQGLEQGLEGQPARAQACLHPLQGLEQDPLFRGEIGAEGEVGEQPSLTIGREIGLQPRREIVPERVRDRIVGGDLLGLFGGLQQACLEARVSDVQKARDDLLIRAAPDQSDAVFRDHDIAQVPGDGGMTIVPYDVGYSLAPIAAGAPEQDNGTGIGQRMRHGDEVVLPADPAHDLSVLKAVGDHRADERAHEGSIDKACVLALQCVQYGIGG